MLKLSFKNPPLLPAALVMLVAAAFAFGQEPNQNKHNQRPEILAAPVAVAEKRVPASYAYEFTQPEFFVRRILIEHDAEGRGRISFQKLNEETAVTEPLDMSQATLTRISALWDTLGFLESQENYQAPRQYPHLGTMRLTMARGSQKRTAEFNWTNHKEAAELANEYRKLADQSMLVFDISVSRESQPLNSPKLMDQLEGMLKRNDLSDPKQLLPLLRDISIDEHLPLIARNHALRLIKKIEK
jgi:hypothetical protein